MSRGGSRGWLVESRNVKGPSESGFRSIGETLRAGANLSPEIADSRCDGLYKLGGAGALRTVKEYNETMEYIHQNSVRWGLGRKPEEWRELSVHEHGPLFPLAVPDFGV